MVPVPDLVTVLVVASVATVGAIALHPRCAATAADHAKQYSGEKVNENRSALADCDAALVGGGGLGGETAQASGTGVGEMISI